MCSCLIVYCWSLYRQATKNTCLLTFKKTILFQILAPECNAAWAHAAPRTTFQSATAKRDTRHKTDDASTSTSARTRTTAHATRPPYAATPRAGSSARAHQGKLETLTQSHPRPDASPRLSVRPLLTVHSALLVKVEDVWILVERAGAAEVLIAQSGITSLTASAPLGHLEIQGKKLINLSSKQLYSIFKNYF